MFEHLTCDQKLKVKVWFVIIFKKKYYVCLKHKVACMQSLLMCYYVKNRLVDSSSFQNTFRLWVEQFKSVENPVVMLKSVYNAYKLQSLVI